MKMKNKIVTLALLIQLFITLKHYLSSIIKIIYP